MALLPTQRPAPPITTSSTGAAFFRAKQLSLPTKRTTFLIIAIASALLILNSARVELSFTSSSSSAITTGHQKHVSNAPVPTPVYTNNESHDDTHNPIVEVPTLDHADDDEEWRFSDDGSGDQDEDGDGYGGEDITGGPPAGPQPNPHLAQNFAKTFPDAVPSTCPNLFFTTTTSFDLPSFTSSSTVSVSDQGQNSPVSATTNLLQPDQVHCQPISSQLQDHKVAFCISKTDCSRGFIQIIQDATANEGQLGIKVSKSHIHDAYFRLVAGPNDYYFVLEGSQKLALSAHLVSENLMVDLGSSTKTSETTTKPRLFVYRADFKMTLPGPVQISGWLTYEKFRAIRENQPGVWPQWTHSVLVSPDPAVGSINKTPMEPSTQFNVCPSCDLDSFVTQLASFRDTHFEQCDRMAPVRGAYWREDLAMRNPYQPTCDSIASPGADMRPPVLDGTQAENKSDKGDYPKRKVLFTGDSQVRATYNAILNYYRPMEMSRQKYAAHDEFIPGRESTTLLGEPSEEEKAAFPALAKTVIRRKESDTEIELVYKADQFLDYLVHSRDEELDEYDTIYFNLGQWPASGPVAGGQWSTDDLIERFENVVGRLTYWRHSREKKWRAARVAAGERVENVQPPATIIIWAGQNAFPMRTDASIRAKGDWRTNARLGYWDDLTEGFSQTEGAWFRRMNSWQITFPMLDQVTDKAHFQQTDAIDALMTEALYKLDFCSLLRSDTPYSVPSKDV
ncbi:hypothetical protein BGW38_008549 [Lunasporangiospora selenospora]|uniref:Uncharacterized protein n=1 Tax=Lunasporangiospora selenospora TaxID=979761 RepID=A0A9P6FZ08_9FUNG|nr:hypothetical protein BGW38_008549 [Lunasporangiospora selenospora]